jgi:FKBP-type peptidyl-prolyl cis-trans isomerase
MSTSNLELGKTFLANNAKQPGVITTRSGLQYLVLTEGTGKSPRLRDSVQVHYRGTSIGGFEFDRSSPGQPVEFILSQVIRGWQEGVQLMKEGAKFRFFIPSKLAYGEEGFGVDIEPDETLIFEVELLKVLG